MSGATLQSSGSVAVGGLELNAGAMTGSGDVTVASTFAQTSGVIDIGGALGVTQTAGRLLVQAPITAASVTLMVTDAVAGSIAISAPVRSTSGNIVFNSVGAIDIAANITSAGVFRATAGGDFNVASATIAGTRIELLFTDGSDDFFVNGLQGLITDQNAGFFSAGLPAVLGATLDVTYGAGRIVVTVADPIVVTATNELIEATTRLIDPLQPLEQGGGAADSTFKEQDDPPPASEDPADPEASRRDTKRKEC